jgi:hypothetical protein
MWDVLEVHAPIGAVGSSAGLDGATRPGPSPRPPQGPPARGSHAARWRGAPPNRWRPTTAWAARGGSRGHRLPPATRGGGPSNAGRQARRAAGARYERTLAAVACTPMLGSPRPRTMQDLTLANANLGLAPSCSP